MKLAKEIGTHSDPSEFEARDFASWLRTRFTKSIVWYLLTLALVAGAYFVAAWFGLSLASVHTNVSPVWPPTGIALAAVLLLGYRTWPAILIGAFLANLLTTPVPLPIAAAIAFGNTAEALAMGSLLRLVDFRESLDRVVDVVKFVVAAVVCTTISATIGNISLVVGHSASWADFGSLWVTWWLGDLTGATILAPLLLTWCAGRHQWLPRRRYIESVILVLLLSVSAIATFGKQAPAPLLYQPLTRLMLPFLLWAGFRLGRRGVTIAVAVVSAFAIWGTAHGTGPFIGGTANQSLIVLQLYLSTNALTFLFLGVVVEEKHRLDDERRRNEQRLAANLAINRILAESPALEDAAARILQTVVETLRWSVGTFWMPDPDAKLLRNFTVWTDPNSKVVQFANISRERTFAPGTGLPGRVWESGNPIWIPDVAKDQNFPRAPAAIAEGLHGAFAFPILFADRLLGVMEFFSHKIRKPDPDVLQMFDSIGKQFGQFMERKRAESALAQTANALSENEERLRLAMQTGKVGIWDWDIPGNRVAWTDSLYSILGVSREGFDGTVESFAALVHPDDRTRVDQALDETLREDKPYELEFRSLRPDGQTISLFTSAVVVRSNGEPRRMLGATLDITEIKRAEEALLRNAQELSEFFENASEAIHWVSADGTILRANQAELRMLGYPAEEYVGRNIAEFHVDGEVVQDILQRLKQGETIEAQPARMRCKDGSIRDVMINSTTYFENGEFVHSRCFTRDVTEQLQIDRVRGHFAAIVETTDDAVVSKDLNGIIMSWNRAAERLFGYKADEVIGKSVSILIPPEREDEEPGILARLRRGERLDHYETVRMTKDGRRFHVSLTVSPIIDAEGKIIGASKIARDIDAQKQAQEQLASLLASERAARHDAEVANRSKDEFLAVLSHEMRTPLTAMLGWLTILRSHKLDPETTKHAIETVERNAKAQAQLIEDLVDISRIVGGKLNLEVRPIEVMPVIEAAVDVVRPAADAKQINLQIHEELVPPVSADPARLQQVIWNLLSNAVKFTPKGGAIDVYLRQVESSAEIVIRDNGVGITPDFLPLVFERFRQAESVATRSHRGMGLGLAIVRHLIELHGGTVVAESEGENKGSVFSLRLPLAAFSFAGVVRESRIPANGNEEILKGLRILLVEDEPDASEVIAMVLKDSGAQVEAVESARDALQRMPFFYPDVLLSDIGLPVESGYDLIKQVRALASDFKTVPAIALTAFATEADRNKSLSAGFQAHLAKPVEPADLVRTIRSVVNGTS
jgi:PAS domain S-box-containing protein